MRRGDVFEAHLEPRSGAEQRGQRPVVVVSTDAFNAAENWLSVIVVPLSTSPRQAARVRTTVMIPRGTAGLRRESVAVCHQVTTIDRSKLRRRLGSLPRQSLEAVSFGLRAAMDLF